MSGQLTPAPVFRSWDNLGFPLIGGKLFTYQAGTLIPQATYTDSTQGTPNTNPVILNFRGEAFVWIDPTLSYKFVLQDGFGNLIWTEDNISGPLASSGNLIPTVTNTFTLGSLSRTWANAYFGPSAAPVFDPVSGNIGYYARTAAESAAGVTPTNYVYEALDCRRYGADPTGSSDSTAAFNSLFAVILALGGASITIWPGTYKINSTITANFAPSSGPTAVTYGVSLYAHGVIFNFTGTGYAFDLFATNTAAIYGFPLLQVYGAKLIGNALATGGWRTRSMSSVRFNHCDVQGFTNSASGTGAAWTVLNDVNWSENCHWRGCAAINCQTGIAFQRNGGTNSFARTYIDAFLGAGITGFWFDIGGTLPGGSASGSCSVYESRWTHISGNFISTAIWGIGNSTNATDMTGTEIDGVHTEINAVVSPQGLIQLRDYPQNSGVARRPVVYNVSSLSLFNGSGNNPIWLSNTGSALQQPESLQTQAFISNTGLQSFETLQSLNANRPVATYDTQQVSCTLTGVSGTVTGRVNFYRVGTIAFAEVFDPLTGTSNATSMTVTGIPAEFTPANTGNDLCFVTNSGAATLASYSVSGTTISFALATAVNNFNGSNFTNTGTKGLTAGTILKWPLT